MDLGEPSRVSQPSHWISRGFQSQGWGYRTLCGDLLSLRFVQTPLVGVGGPQ